MLPAAKLYLEISNYLEFPGWPTAIRGTFEACGFSKESLAIVAPTPAYASEFRLSLATTSI